MKISCDLELFEYEDDVISQLFFGRFFSNHETMVLIESAVRNETPGFEVFERKSTELS